MKITDVKTYVVENPPPHYGGPYWVFIKLTTDHRVEGFGEAYCVPFRPQIVALMIEDVCERYVIGSDPFKIERLWRIIYSSGYTQHPDLSLVGVLSAIEMACWDIVGKELDKPIYELLGGQVHEKLRSYMKQSATVLAGLYTFARTPSIWCFSTPSSSAGPEKRTICIGSRGSFGRRALRSMASQT